MYLPEVLGVYSLPGAARLPRCGAKVHGELVHDLVGTSVNQRSVHGEQYAAQRAKGESPAVLQERGVPSAHEEASDRFAYALRSHCTRKVRLAADATTAG